MRVAALTENVSAALFRRRIDRRAPVVDTTGSMVVEFALLAPFLLMLFVGIAYSVLIATEYARVESAAAAGASYVRAGGEPCADTVRDAIADDDHWEVGVYPPCDGSGNAGPGPPSDSCGTRPGKDGQTAPGKSGEHRPDNAGQPPSEGNPGGRSPRKCVTIVVESQITLPLPEIFGVGNVKLTGDAVLLR